MDHVAQRPVFVGRPSRWTTLDALFRSEVRRECALHPPSMAHPVTEGDLARLPPPVARHFRLCGYLGQPHAVNVRVVWRELALKLGRGRPWMVCDVQQWNGFMRPARLALMKGRMAGVLPFEGRDKFQDGHGQMLVKLLKVFTVADVTGPEMDASALVTFLSEVFFAPSAALRPYVTWTAVDDRTTRATLHHAGLQVGGTFHFDDSGFLTRFDTDDRWQDGKPPRRIPWSAELGAYELRDGIRIPTRVIATWHEDAGDFTYGQGIIERLVFNVD